MSDEVNGCIVMAMVVGLVGFTIWGSVSIVENSTTTRELQKRGLKEYDRATGRLIWTEKAGGEKGGDK